MYCRTMYFIVTFLLLLPNYQLAMETGQENNHAHVNNNNQEAPLRRCVACRQLKRNFFMLDRCGHEFCKDCIKKMAAASKREQDRSYYCLDINCHVYIGTDTAITIDGWLKPSNRWPQCQSCGDEHLHEDLYTLTCHHKFCINCLKQVFTQSHNKEFSCPNGTCKVSAIDIQRIESLMLKKTQTHAEVRRVYQEMHERDSLIIRRNSNHQQNLRECQTCTLEKPENEFPQLTSCHHNNNCNVCIEQVIDTSIRDRNTLHLRCPLPECRRELVDADIHDQNKLRTIQYLRIRTQPNARQCPRGGCVYAYIYNGQPAATQCPLCNDRYCSDCLRNHDLQAITCQQARAQEEARVNAATAATIQQTTKACTHCRAHIEKNEGCNHMTCENCHGEFCWICLTDWRAEDHNDHKFGDYTIEDVRRIRNQHREQIRNNNQQRENNNRPLFNRAEFENNQFNIDQFLINNQWDQRRLLLSTQQLQELDNRINKRQTITNTIEQDARIWIDELTALEQDIKNSNIFINPKTYALLAALIPPIFITWKISQWINNPTAIKTTIREIDYLITTAKNNDSLELNDHLNKTKKNLMGLSQAQIVQLHTYIIDKQFDTFIAYANTCKKELSSVGKLQRIKIGCRADLTKIKHWLINK